MRRLFGKGAQVIALSEYRGTMRFPLVNEVEAYWEGLRAGRVLPDRAEVDPRGLERALDHVFILERVAPGIVRFRVAGSHLAGLMGMEISGMPLSALFTAAARPALAAHVQRLFDGPQTLRLTLSGEGAHGLYGTMLLLPLRSETGAIGRALGCLVTEGGGARAPCRLRIDAARVKPLPPLLRHPRARARHGVFRMARKLCAATAGHQRKRAARQTPGPSACQIRRLTVRAQRAASPGGGRQVLRPPETPVPAPGWH